jgi:tryptophan-rich sensory protein
MAASRSSPVVVAALAAIGVGVLGGLMTDIGGWYANLAKPPWQPPDWLFAPVWTAIYALTAIAGVLAWNASETDDSRKNLLIVFLLNAVLNVTWSLLFFRMRRPDWAMFEVAFLWASILLLMYVCWRRRPLAAALLLPYFAWVSFAAILNVEVVRLNPQAFGG